jgi:hypothetical protein
VLVVAALAGCGVGSGDGSTANEARTTTSAAPPPRPGSHLTHEQQVESLLRDVRNIRARCATGRPLPQRVGMSRFQCTGGGQTYTVDWQHYGDGRYTISQGGRVVARGTLSVVE